MSNFRTFLAEVTRELVRISDSPALELLGSCFVTPLDIEDHSADLSRDAVEDEAWEDVSSDDDSSDDEAFD